MCITKMELESMVQDLRKLRAMKEEINGEIKAMEFQIIGYMTENNLQTEITNSAKVTYQEQTRTTLDQKALTKMLGDDLNQFQRTTTYNVLRIR